MSQKQKREHRLFIKRSCQMLKNAQIRTKGALQISLQQLRELIVNTPDCPYCHKPISAKDFSLDHITPLSRGGTNELHNLAICHKRCNKIKGILTDEEWRKLVAFMVIDLSPIAHADILARLHSGGNRFSKH